MVPQSFLPLLPFIWMAPPAFDPARIRTVVGEVVPAGMTVFRVIWHTYVYPDPGEQLTHSVVLAAEAKAFVAES